MLPTHGQAASLDLGTLAPDVATVEQMVRNRITKTGRPLLLFRPFCRAVDSLPQLVREVRQNALDERAAADYEATENHGAALRARSRVEVRGSLDPATAHLLALSRHIDMTPDFEGWLRYLYASGPFQTALDDPKYSRAALFHESGLEESCLIVAPKKWGKSELLKALIYHHVSPPYDKAPAAAVIVLDPGTDLAVQVARWPELSGPDRVRDRLVYVEPDLREGLAVGVNPLDGIGLGHRDRDKVAGMLEAALGSLVADLSLGMRNLIRPCATVMLWRPGSTLRTLHDLLSDPAKNSRTAGLYAEACGYPDSADVRTFFRYEFNSESYKSTKEYLRRRLHKLLLTHDLAGLFGGAGTLDLRAAIEARKVVIFNLGKLENEEDIALAGRLLVTMVAAIARKRVQNASAARTPIYLVIDEVTVLAGGELVKAIAQLRKFGLNPILAQQVMGSGWSGDDKATLIENTGCKFIGGRDRRLVTDMLASAREGAQTLPPIERGQFWVEWPEKGGPHLLNVRSDLAGWTKHSVTDKEWAGYVDQATDELSGYYRRVASESDLEEELPASTPAPAAGATPSPARKPRASDATKGAPLVAPVGAKRPEPRKKRTAKPVAVEEKPPEVRRTRRKLGE